MADGLFVVSVVVSDASPSLVGGSLFVWCTV